jgi:low temperature requirement protein LtrA
VTGILRSVVIFWLVWWGWTQFTWALNAADTEHQGVRAITLLATGVAFVMAVSVENGFSPELREVLPFAASYVAIRILGRARARGGGRRSGRDRRDRTGDHSPTTGPLEARVDGTEETPV